MNKDRNDGDRMVLLVPSQAESGASPGGLDLEEIWNVLWGGKWLIIGITSVFTVVSIVYALLATQWFRAEVALMPAHPRQALSAQLGGLAGLASLAGLNISERGDTAEALAVLRSREFTRSFIEELNLLPVLLADKWDAQAGRWKGSDPEKWPDERDAVKYFENRVRRIAENKKTGLITLSIDWKDRETAAKWANLLVVRANDRMRQRAQSDAERNIKFLRQELNSTNVVTLQESISRLLEHELETLMMARGNEEYAFRVVDRAGVPKWRARPKRTLTVILATMGGGLIAVLAAFVRHSLRRRRELAEDTLAPAARSLS